MPTVLILPADILKLRLDSIDASSRPVFTGLNLVHWLDDIERLCLERDIPDLQRVDTAISFLNGNFKQTMESRRAHMMRFGAPAWYWDDFKQQFPELYGALEMKLDVWMTDSPPLFQNSQNDVFHWFSQIEEESVTRGFGDAQLTDVAIFFLPPSSQLQTAMETRNKLLCSDETTWRWEDFKQEIIRRCGSLDAKIKAWEASSNPPPLIGESSRSELDDWIQRMEDGFREWNVAPLQGGEAAVPFLVGDLKTKMKARLRIRNTLRSGQKGWSWDDFKRDLKEILIPKQTAPAASSWWDVAWRGVSVAKAATRFAAPAGGVGPMFAAVAMSVLKNSPVIEGNLRNDRLLGMSRGRR